NASVGAATGANIAVVFRRQFFFFLSLRILHASRNDDLHGHFFVDRGYIVVAIAIVEDTDHGFLLALHNADDPAFGPAIVADAAHLYQNLVAVHGVADFWRRNKDIALQLALGPRRQGTGLRDDEAVAVTMHAQPADDQVLVGGGGRQAPALFADSDELAAVGHLTEKVLQLSAVAAFEAEIVNELLKAGDVLRLLGDVMEDLLFGDH